MVDIIGQNCPDHPMYYCNYVYLCAEIALQYEDRQVNLPYIVGPRGPPKRLIVGL